MFRLLPKWLASPTDKPGSQGSALIRTLQRSLEFSGRRACSRSPLKHAVPFLVDLLYS